MAKKTRAKRLAEAAEAKRLQEAALKQELAPLLESNPLGGEFMKMLQDGEYLKKLYGEFRAEGTPTPPPEYLEMRAKEQRMQYAKAQLDAQVREQVAAWKTEVEENKNFLVGMMLSEAHPKIVSYRLTQASEFGPAPMGVKFQWNEPKKVTDPQVDQELLKQLIKNMMTAGELEAEPGELGKEGAELFAEMLKQQAQEGQGAALAGIQKAMEEMQESMKGGGFVPPEARAEAAQKQAALEKQKEEWARQEREIARAFGGELPTEKKLVWRMLPKAESPEKELEYPYPEPEAPKGPPFKSVAEMRAYVKLKYGS